MSKPGDEIVVNIDEWMKQRHSGETFDKTLVRVEEQSKEQEFLEETEGPRECASCGQTKRHYIGDYICHECRDETEG